MAEQSGVDHRACAGTGCGGGSHQLPPVHSPQLPLALVQQVAGHVQLFPFDVALTVTVQLQQFAEGLLFAFQQLPAIALLNLLARQRDQLAIDHLAADLQRYRLVEPQRQPGGGLLQPLFWLAFDLPGDGLKTVAPGRLQVGKGRQQVGLQAGLRQHRVEDAYQAEVLLQGLFPFRDMLLALDRVDQAHAGLAAPAQNLHFRLVLGAVGTRAVDHIEDGRAGHDRS